jgi:hypothetical protein
MNKPIIYAEIPEFDQATQAVFQTEPEDRGEYIYYGVTIVDLPPSKAPKHRTDLRQRRVYESII